MVQRQRHQVLGAPVRWVGGVFVASGRGADPVAVGEQDQHRCRFDQRRCRHTSNSASGGVNAAGLHDLESRVIHVGHQGDGRRICVGCTEGCDDVAEPVTRMLDSHGCQGVNDVLRQALFVEGRRWMSSESLQYLQRPPVGLVHRVYPLFFSRRRLTQNIGYAP